MTSPLISVLVDTYNHERYIEQAIVSVLEQGLSPSEMEVIVVDDGSTDNTPSVVQKFVPRVRHLRKKNGGQASAFNAGIAESHAPVVAFLDGDDWWAKDKASISLDALERNPDAAAVGHGYFEIYDDGERYVVTPEHACRLDLSTENAARTASHGRNFLGGSMISIRRRVLDRMGPVPEELKFSADSPIANAALALGGAIILDQPLCYYRMHSGNLFSFRSTDETKLRRRNEALALVAETVPRQLAAMGVPQEVITALFEEDWLQVHRFQLQYGKGSRWKTFLEERKAYRITYKNPTAGYALFKWLVGAVTLLLPSRRFYELRAWYARRNMDRVRRIVGDAELVHSQTFTQKRKITPGPPSGAPEGRDSTRS